MKKDAFSFLCVKATWSQMAWKNDVEWLEGWSKGPQDGIGRKCAEHGD
mgnify:CR=1 FL=1